METQPLLSWPELRHLQRRQGDGDHGGKLEPGHAGAENLAMGVDFKSATRLVFDETSRWHRREPGLIVGQMTVYPMRHTGVGTIAYSLLSSRSGTKGTQVSDAIQAGTHHSMNHNTTAVAGQWSNRFRGGSPLAPGDSRERTNSGRSFPALSCRRIRGTISWTVTRSRM